MVDKLIGDLNLASLINYVAGFMKIAELFDHLGDGWAHRYRSDGKEFWALFVDGIIIHLDFDGNDSFL